MNELKDAWHCGLCHEPIRSMDFFTGEHMRVMHPDYDGAPEYWADGSIVVFDDTIEEEFR